MYQAQTYPDLNQAKAFLIAQRDETKDPKFKQLLDLRVGRLAGLIELQEAQANYEKRFGRPLQDANLLLSSGMLKQFPIDPVGMGYVFEEGQFALRELKIRGMKGVRK